MDISEGARSNLYTALSEVIGETNTETLMSALPHDLSKLVTQDDLARELLKLRLEMAQQFADLRASMYRWHLTTLLAVVAAIIGSRLIG